MNNNRHVPTWDAICKVQDTCNHVRLNIHILYVLNNAHKSRYKHDHSTRRSGQGDARYKTTRESLHLDGWPNVSLKNIIKSTSWFTSLLPIRGWPQVTYAIINQISWVMDRPTSLTINTCQTGTPTIRWIFTTR